MALWLAFAFVAAGEVQQLGLVIGQWHADVKALHHVRRIRTIGQRVPYAQRTTSQGFEFSAEFESCGLIDSAICQPTIADFGFLRDGESWGPASTELHQSREVRSTGFILGIIDCNAETAQSRTGEGIQRTSALTLGRSSPAWTSDRAILVSSPGTDTEGNNMTSPYRFDSERHFSAPAIMPAMKYFCRNR